MSCVSRSCALVVCDAAMKMPFYPTPPSRPAEEEPRVVTEHIEEPREPCSTALAPVKGGIGRRGAWGGEARSDPRDPLYRRLLPDLNTLLSELFPKGWFMEAEAKNDLEDLIADAIREFLSSPSRAKGRGVAGMLWDAFGKVYQAVPVGGPIPFEDAWEMVQGCELCAFVDAFKDLLDAWRRYREIDAWTFLGNRIIGLPPRDGAVGNRFWWTLLAAREIVVTEGQGRRESEEWEQRLLEIGWIAAAALRDDGRKAGETGADSTREKWTAAGGDCGRPG